MKSFTELTGKEKSIEVLRWICVPAAAVLGVLALHLIAGFVMPRAAAQLPGSETMPTSDSSRVILRSLSGILTGAIFVIAGAKLAPRGRLATAIVLAGLWCLAALSSHVLMQSSRGLQNYTDFLAEAVGAAVAAVAIHVRQGRRS